MTMFDIDVGVSAQIDDGEHIVQQFSRPAHEGQALKILLFAGPFAYKQDISLIIADTENHVISGFTQFTAAAFPTDGFQIIPRKHISNSFCGLRGGGGDGLLPAFGGRH